MHANPGDPQARGKMERFWLTMRQGCMNHMGKQSSTHDVQVRLLAWLGERYHTAPHAGLLGRAPTKAWSDRKLIVRSEEELVDALTVRETRRVRTDCTLTVGNVDWEVSEAFLADRKLTVARTLADPQRAPWIEHDDRSYRLRPVDPVANGRRRKRRKPKPGIDAVDFDPVEVLLDHVMGRLPRRGGRQ